MSTILTFIVELDFYIEKLILSWRNVYLDNFFFPITHLGDWLAIGIAFIIVASFLFKYSKYNLIANFLFLTIGTGLTAIIIKAIVDRTRPTGDSPLYIESLSSFPSAHSALVFAFYGFIIYCLFRFEVKMSRKILGIFFCVLIILLIGFSRLYLGVHFFSDVLGGYLVGLLWLLIAMYLSRRSFRH